MSTPSSPPSSLPPRAGLAGDAWGGLAAMLVALPSSIAYGVAVFGLLGGDYIAHGVRAGLLGAIALGIVTAIVGGAPRLISAPCAPAAAVLAALVGQLLGGTPVPASPERIIALLTMVALMSAVLQLGYGFAGGGRLIKFIPYPVVSGYLSAVGAIIFIGQLPKFLGLAHGVKLATGLLAPASWQVPALVVGAATIAGVLLAKRITRVVPAPIIGLAAGVAAYFLLGLRQPELLSLEHNHLVIGPVGGGLALFSGLAGPWQALTGLHAGDLRALIVPALTLSVLLSVDTLKTGVVVDALTQGRHDSNRTLLAQGAGNVAAVFLGGMAGSGTMGPTLVNVEAGGHSRRSGLIEGGLMLMTALVLGRAIAWVPVAALAGILLVVGVRMIDWGSLLLLRQRATVLDFSVIATVVVVAVTTNLIAASGAGVALAIILFIREQIHGSVIRRRVSGRQISSTQHRMPDEQAVIEQHGSEVLVCELQGSLFFGTTDQMLTEIEEPLRTCRYLILDLRRVQSVDFTAAHLLERFEKDLARRDGWLLFSRVPAHLPSGRNLHDYFAKLGVVGAQRRVRVCASLDDALIWTEDRILADYAGAGAGADTPLPLGEFDLLREFDTDQTMAPFTPCVTERSHAAGDVIFKSGDTGNQLYLVRRGIVRVRLPLKDGGYHNLASFGRGNFFGEMSFLTREARSAEAVAITATDLYVIERSQFDATSRSHPLVGVKMFARLARALAVRLRRTDIELRAFYET
ncbi:MAG: SulP family inorganic anion transporter [Lacunisphaera sp.]|nr:SulP family inorganic anion transporter [Lacunisphaera sp.]